MKSEHIEKVIKEFTEKTLRVDRRGANDWLDENCMLVLEKKQKNQTAVG